ncbi:uncharacterized protein [Mytilus edulis]|uniref:uncharacterized protein n=1 Tax=Mytilus edulis TaxID=6550 RepID=UPI0039F04ABA
MFSLQLASFIYRDIKKVMSYNSNISGVCDQLQSDQFTNDDKPCIIGCPDYNKDLNDECKKRPDLSEETEKHITSLNGEESELSRSFYNKTLTLERKMYTMLANVNGCSMLPDGRMVFACAYWGKIKVFRPDGSEDFEMKNIGPLCDVVSIGNDSLVVTSGDDSYSRQIYIIDIENKKVKKKINVNSHSLGAALFNDNCLCYCAGKLGIQEIYLKEEFVNNVTSTEMSPHAYLATLGNTIYYTDRKTHSVTCMRTLCMGTGEHISWTVWTFKDENVLKSPNGIAVDNIGSVYVSGGPSCNVVVISNNGLFHKELLSKEDGLTHPGALHYDRSTNKLLVANSYDYAYLYNVNN